MRDAALAAAEARGVASHCQRLTSRMPCLLRALLATAACGQPPLPAPTPNPSHPLHPR